MRSKCIAIVALWIMGNMLFMSCKEPFTQGRRLYEGYCAGCHMHDGSGLEGITPPLYQADYLSEHLRQLPCIIRYGLFDTIDVNGITYTDFMLGYPKLTEAEISNISNYIAYKFLNIDQPTFTPPIIRQVLDSCKNIKKSRKDLPFDRDSVRMFQSI